MNFQYQTKTISFSSGKGGVGKTTLAANVAYKLSQSGKKVLIFDADLGMANVDIFFGSRAPHTVMDVICGNMKLKDIIHPLDKNLYLISGGHGFDQMQNLDSFSRRQLIDSLSELPDQFEHLIIDTSPGITANVLQINAAAQSVILVLTSDPASFADSYALLKLLNTKHHVKRFSVVCNQVRNHEDGFYMFKRFQDVVLKFLHVSLDFLGSVPQDPQLRRANLSQCLVLKQNPGSDASIAISQISNEILKTNTKIENVGGMQFFWENWALPTSRSVV